MKPPQWFRTLLAAECSRVLARAITDEEAAVRLINAVLRDSAFTQMIVAEHVRRQVKHWLASHRGAAADDGEDGQLDLFPDIPRNIEVAPGRFVAQGFMTRRDWNAAVKQAETKASNAGNFAEAIKRTAEKVLPLFTDDEMTTAEALKPGTSGQASGAQ